MDIFSAVIIVSLIGIIIGIGLSVASSVFSVPKDENEEAVRECLPGANCGACGYSGCDGYASAIAKGEVDNISLCTPGGNEVAARLAELTGKAADDIVPPAAVVMCKGICDNSPLKLEYGGVKTCKAAHGVFGGQKACAYGCLGYGDCISVCDNGAIRICDGIAKIDVTLCSACQKCVKACPKGIISMLPVNKKQAAVMCKNTEKGAVAQKSCRVSCIGCGKCVKICEASAIRLEDFCAVIDAFKCTGCGACAEACPKHTIEMICLNK